MSTSTPPTITTLVEEDLPMQVDSVAWRTPTTTTTTNSSSTSSSTSSELLLAVGAYQLDPSDSSKRLGRIYLIKLTPSVPGGFTVVHEQPTPGILHLAFNGNDLAVATSTSLILFTVQDDQSSHKLILKYQLDIHAIALFLQWVIPQQTTTTSNNNNRGQVEEEVTRSIALSDSNGFVYLVDVTKQKQLTVKHKAKLHTELTWVVHVVNQSGRRVLLSGCDEGKLVAVTVDNLHSSSPNLKKTITFPGGGVTSINNHNNLIAVGGYDEVLRLYRLEEEEQDNTPPVLTLLSSTPLGGAVWRTHFTQTSNGNKLLLLTVACGRNGLKVLSVSDAVTELLFHFPKYTSFLCYGLDVVLNSEQEELTIATCYFDNHVVHVFNLNLSHLHT